MNTLASIGSLAGRGRGAGVRPACLLGRGHTLYLRQGPEPRGHVHPARADRPPFNTPERPEAQGRGGGGGKWEVWRPPPGQGRKGIIQETSFKTSLLLHCLRKEKKNTARTRQAQRRSSAEWLLRWACTALGSQTPCHQGRVRVSAVL